MMRLTLFAIAIAAAAGLVSCAGQPSASTGPQAPATPAQRPGVAIAEGTVTQISSGHGNAYTSIRPDQYESLGLAPGKRIRVAFAETELTLVIGRTYTDVPSGTPLAVLHREGLTFAIRDGNFSATYGIAAGATFRISAVPGGR